MSDELTNTQIPNSIFLKLTNAGPVEIFPIKLGEKEKAIDSINELKRPVSSQKKIPDFTETDSFKQINKNIRIILWERELRKASILPPIFSENNEPLPKLTNKEKHKIARLNAIRNIKYARMRALAKKLNLTESDIADCFDIDRGF